MKKLFLLFLVISTAAFGQLGSIFPLSSVTLCNNGLTQLCALPTAQIYVCPYVASPYYTGVCPAPVTLYTDPTLGTATTQPLHPDYLANVVAYVPPGDYLVQYVSATGTVLYQQPIGSNGGVALLSFSGLRSAIASNTVNNGDFAQTWNWSLISGSNVGLSIGENIASVAGGTPYLMSVNTLPSSTAYPFRATAQGTSNGVNMNPSGVFQSIGGGQIIADATKLNINTTPPLAGGGLFNSSLTISCPNCIATNQTNSYTAGPQDLNAQAVTQQIPNTVVGGTTNNLLAKLTSLGAITATVADTSTPLYIVDSGGGISGNAKLAIAGQDQCTFDGSATNTEGYFVTASTSIAGDCHAQSGPPAAGYVIGYLVSNATNIGLTSTVNTNLYYVNTSGVGSGAINSGTAGQLTGYATSGNVLSGLPNFTFVNGVLTFGQAGSVQGGFALSGSAANTLNFAVPSSLAGGNTNTFQDVTDTFVYQNTNDTLTGKTINAEATGNNISIPTKAFFAAAGCNNGTAGTSWDIGTTNQPSPACVGVNSIKGILNFARGNVAYINFELPVDWNPLANVDLRIGFTTDDITVGHVTAFNAQTGCAAPTATVTDDPTLNAAQIVSTTIPSGAISEGYEVAQLNAMSTAGCSVTSGINTLVIAITRNNSGTDTNTDTSVSVKFAELTFGRTMNGANR